MEKRLFTSESVTEGHPDKICDAVSDAVLDALMEQDPFSRVACETCTNTGFVLVMGEITTKANIDIPAIVRKTVTEIGYDSSEKGFDGNTCAVMVSLDKQSTDIAMGVDHALETREEALGKKQNELQKMQEDIENDKQRQVAEMERIAGMTQDEACQMLVSRIQGTARVVNYAGLVYGETQRIIKLEGAGLPQDGMIEDVASFAAFAARLNRSRFRPTRIFRSIMISAFRCPSRSMKSRSKNKLPPNA